MNLLVILAIGAGLWLCWFLTSPLWRSASLRSLWLGAARATIRSHNFGYPGIDVWAKRFNAPVPALPVPLETFGLPTMTPDQELRIYEIGFGDFTMSTSQKTRRKWIAAAKAYDADISAAQEQLLQALKQTVANPRAYLPFGYAALLNEREKALERYLAQAEIAGRTFQPIYAIITDRRRKWRVREEQLRARYAAQRAEQRRKGEALAQQHIWGYHLDRVKKTIQIFRSNQSATAANTTPMTAKQIGDALFDYWDDETFTITRTAGAEDSVQAETGLDFDSWWRLATGRNFVRQPRSTHHGHYPYSSAYGSFHT